MSFNALNIDFYLCGGIHSRGYAPDEQTTALLQELTAILDRLQSDDHEPDLHAIWLSAKRPTFRQYYEQYYPETPYDIVDAETEKMPGEPIPLPTPAQRYGIRCRPIIFPAKTDRRSMYSA